jgi:hypothetical protein
VEKNCSQDKLWANPQPIATTPVALYVRKHAFDLESFDKLIQRIVEAGLLQHWESRLMMTHRRAKESTEKLLLSNNAKLGSGSEDQPLQFAHIQGAVIFLVGGLGGALVTFGVEVVYTKWRLPIRC